MGYKAVDAASRTNTHLTNGNSKRLRDAVSMAA